jgi:hypothetical protein
METALLVVSIFAATADVSGVLPGDDCNLTVQEFSKGAKFVEAQSFPQDDALEIHYSLIGRNDVIYIICEEGDAPDTADDTDNGDETDSGDETES